MSRPHPPTRVAYVLTHYPKLTQTFLRREIETIASDELQVLPVAINAPEPGEIVTTEDRREAARTFYVKAAPRRRMASAMARGFVRRPGSFVRAALRALRPAGADGKALLWRSFYFVEAVITWDHCRRNGVRHLHAQFGGTPSTIAMLVADLGCRTDGPGTWTWSFTIHGFHDFVNEREIGLGAKAADASFAVCISDYIASQLMRVTDPAHWGKIHTVRCGIDLDEFARRPPRPAGEPPRILTVGRLSAEKGHGVLLDAVRLLHDRGVDVRVEFVGSGPMHDELAERARDAGLADLVHLAGELPPSEVNRRLRDADVFCLPSFAEGLPISIMEAMAVGVPVVSTYVGGIPELVRDGITGRCVPAGRADLLADAIERLVSDPGVRAAMVSAARAAVEAEHEQHRNVATLRSLMLATAQPSPAAP
jgi:glycosyltransferase involved in cell wall biosynthesis